ncbi:MAG: AbrB/MazE/SpoVT family DNA-binding domain-containing protein [Methanolinea sp.]|jgi:phosphate uptake regulator|nr:AbrB/MazE/SpoVT family DNA-binding domain-containing protein [Methanolinea sp.]
MEIRKVQITGGSSFVITLPKEWAEKQQVKKNDPLGLVAQPDGTLLVTTDLSETPAQRAKTFDVTAIDDPTFLFRLLIGSYIAGYTSISITSKNRLPASIRMVVRDFTQMTIGPEVVEETDTSILLKDLLNPAEMPFENTIKRMYVIVKNMYMDALTVLETGNAGLANDVIARDNDVDRLHWLVARQTNIILKNASLARKMGMAPSVVVNTYIISRIIERIGDHAVRYVEQAGKIRKDDLGPERLEAVRKAAAQSRAIFDRSIVSYFKADIKESHANIEQVEVLERLCQDITSHSTALDPEVAVPLRYIAESIRRAGEYAGDISENVINMLVEDRI